MKDDFESRLQQAIQRGQRRQEQDLKAARAEALTEDELRRRHGHYRLQLSEHIEQHFPGFQYETIYGERGWGAACSRDDLRIEGGRRGSDYSRLEMTVRPYSSYHVLDLVAKGTIHNKEIFNRSHFEEIPQVNPTRFLELIDLWVLEFAELFAAKTS